MRMLDQSKALDSTTKWSGVLGAAAEETNSDLPRFPAPPGFRRLEENGVIALVREDLMASLIGAGLLERGGLLEGRTSEDSYQGRGSTAIIRLGSQRVVVRRFLPGGLLRFVRPSTFVTPERPFRELSLYLHLRALGFPTLEPAAAVARRRGSRWILHLVTVQLEGARELLGLLQPGSASRLERRMLLRLAGDVVRRLHEAGIHHADLHLKNLLWNGAQVHVIDLDRSRLESDVSITARVQNLSRLWRFARRYLEPETGLPMLQRDAIRFLSAYEPDRSIRRELVLAVLRREARGGWVHRLNWWWQARLTKLRALRRARC